MTAPFDAAVLQPAIDEHVPGCRLILNRQTGSTNEDALNAFRSGERGNALYIAERQSSGRGTKGRQFFSPEGGIYFTLMLQPAPDSERLSRLTVMAAAAAAEAADAVSGRKTRIKWVNDIMEGDRKVCGILCEAVADKSSGGCAVIGVGADVYAPEGGFRSELSGIAGALVQEPGKSGMREQFTAVFLSEFFEMYSGSGDALYEKYLNRLNMIGKRVEVIRRDGAESAVAVGLSKDFRLEVRYENGETEFLLSDEISVRETQTQVLRQS